MGILLGLFLVELLLQVGSAWVAWRTPPPSTLPGSGPPQSADHVVLCLGDSFTFGSGATSPEGSYPRALERTLRESDASKESWAVINAGWPGRNSQEAAHILPDLLSTYRPQFVCILVGLNNQWNDRAPDEQAAKESGWRWRWRTKRLLQIAAEAARKKWGNKKDATAEIVDGERGATGDSVGSDVEAGVKNVRRESDEAQANAGPTSPSLAQDPRVAALEAELQMPGRLEGARKELLALRDDFDHVANGDRTADFVRVLAKAGLRSEAIDFGLGVLGEGLQSAAVHREISIPLARLGRLDEALAHAESCTRLAPGDAEGWRALSLVHRIRGDFGSAMRCLATYSFLSDDDETLRRLLRRSHFASSVNEESLEAILADISGATEVKRERFRRLVREAKNPTSPTSSLESDLVAMAAAVKAAGAIPYLLTYPFVGESDSTGELILAVAQENGVKWIDLNPVMNEAQTHHGARELYVPDGHCTDLGYRYVAEAVGRILVAETTR